MKIKLKYLPDDMYEYVTSCLRNRQEYLNDDIMWDVGYDYGNTNITHNKCIIHIKKKIIYVPSELYVVLMRDFKLSEILN